MQNNKVNWIEFVFIPILLFSSFLVNIVFSVISNLINTNMFDVLGSQNTAILADFIVNSIIVVLFLFLEKNLKNDIRLAFQFISKNWKFMLFLFILTKIITISINFLSKVSGFSLNLSKTENQLQIIEWIKEPNYFFMSVIIFLSITLIGPISEEILYRHLIIGEIGKILPYKIMAVFSVLIFSIIHVLSAQSLFEILTYFILAVPIVLIYLKSHCNVFVSMTLHVFINLTSYLYIFFK